MSKKVILDGDTVTGHLDFNGTEIPGTVAASAYKMGTDGKAIVRQFDTVTISAHQNGPPESPDIRGHIETITINPGKKLKLQGTSVVAEDDIIIIEGQTSGFTPSSSKITTN